VIRNHSASCLADTLSYSFPYLPYHAPHTLIAFRFTPRGGSLTARIHLTRFPSFINTPFVIREECFI